MYFVQYYIAGCITGEPIEPCGDRAVIILDGRNNLETMKQDAINNNGINRPVYIGFKIFKGESFSRLNPLTPYIKLN